MISQEQAIDYLRELGWLQEHDRALTEGAVPVVRCKDCKYYNPPFEVDGMEFEGDCDFHEWYRAAPTENDFCSRGVRKDV